MSWVGAIGGKVSLNRRIIPRDAAVVPVRRDRIDQDQAAGQGANIAIRAAIYQSLAPRGDHAVQPRGRVGSFGAPDMLCKIWVGQALDCSARLDVALNNAGLVGAMKPLANIEPQEWAEVIAVNLSRPSLAHERRSPRCWKAVVTRSFSPAVLSATASDRLGWPPMRRRKQASWVCLMRSLTADYGALGVRADALNGCRAKNARGRGGRKANGSCPRDVDG